MANIRVGTIAACLLPLVPLVHIAVLDATGAEGCVFTVSVGTDQIGPTPLYS